MKKSASDKPARNAPTIAALNREWIEHWRRVGPLLEERRLQESMTDEERRRAIAAVLGLVRSPPPTRRTSGLVEYYRKLRKLSQ